MEDGMELKRSVVKFDSALLRVLNEPSHAWDDICTCGSGGLRMGSNASLVGHPLRPSPEGRHEEGKAKVETMHGELEEAGGHEEALSCSSTDLLAAACSSMLGGDELGDRPESVRSHKQRAQEHQRDRGGGECLKITGTDGPIDQRDDESRTAPPCW